MYTKRRRLYASISVVTLVVGVFIIFHEVITIISPSFQELVVIGEIQRYTSLSEFALSIYKADIYQDPNKIKKPTVFYQARNDSRTAKSAPQTDQELNSYKFIGCPSVERWPHRYSEDVRYIPVVNYLWLESETFTFKNYLSVLSVIRHLQPTKIIFHVLRYPAPDPYRYHHWWDDLLRSVDYIVIREIDSKDIAPEEAFPKEDGDVFLPVDAILIKTISLPEFSLTDCRTLVWNETLHHLDSPCIRIPFEIFPKDFWYKNDQLSATIRSLFYGTSQLMTPKQSKLGKFQAYCHYVWIGGGEVTLFAYLSILSCIYLGKADAVFIHGNMPPSGFRWHDLVHRFGHNGKLKFLKKEVPESVYGNKIDNVAHISDVWRVDILMKYGGAYLDWDALILRPFDSLPSQHDALANFDIIEWKPYPKVLNLGVFVAKQGSTYLRLLKESMKYFYDFGKQEFVYRYNPIQIPYKVFECFPDQLFIDKHIQVICFEGKCHPTWKENFLDLSKGYDIHWRKDAFSIHWTFPNPPELESEAALKQAISQNSNSMAVDIAKEILKKSGISLN